MEYVKKMGAGVDTITRLFEILSIDGVDVGWNMMAWMLGRMSGETS